MTLELQNQYWQLFTDVKRLTPDTSITDKDTLILDNSEFFHAMHRKTHRLITNSKDGGHISSLQWQGFMNKLDNLRSKSETLFSLLSSPCTAGPGQCSFVLHPIEAPLPPITNKKIYPWQKWLTVLFCSAILGLMGACLVIASGIVRIKPAYRIKPKDVYYPERAATHKQT